MEQRQPKRKESEIEAASLLVSLKVGVAVTPSPVAKKPKVYNPYKSKRPNRLFNVNDKLKQKMWLYEWEVHALESWLGMKAGEVRRIYKHVPASNGSAVLQTEMMLNGAQVRFIKNLKDGGSFQPGAGYGTI